jgi:trans-aconitate methyltransferase
VALDVRCGDGKITAEFARALPDGHVLSLDSSPEFIAYASLHYPKALFSSLQFEVMDSRSLNINNRFDLVFSNAVMHWVDDHSAFLRGVAKHLCIGGGATGSFVQWKRQRICDYCSTGDCELVFCLAALLRGFPFPYHFYPPTTTRLGYQRQA